MQRFIACPFTENLNRQYCPKGTRKNAKKGEIEENIPRNVVLFFVSLAFLASWRFDVPSEE